MTLVDGFFSAAYHHDDNAHKFEYDKYKKNDDAIEALIGPYRIEVAYYRRLSTGVWWAIVRHGHASSYVCSYAYLRNGQQVCYPFTQDSITYQSIKSHHRDAPTLPVLPCLPELLPQWAHELREVIESWRQPVTAELYDDAPYTSLAFDYAKYTQNDDAVAELLGTWQEDFAMTRNASRRSFMKWSVKRNGYSDSSWVCWYTYLRNGREVCYPFTQEPITHEAPLISYLADLLPQWRDEINRLEMLWAMPAEFFGDEGLLLQPGMLDNDDEDDESDDDV